MGRPTLSRLPVILVGHGAVRQSKSGKKRFARVLQRPGGILPQTLVD